MGEVEEEPTSESAAGRWLVVGLGVLVAAGVIAAVMLRPKPAPTIDDIQDDPLLVAGHELYHQRCVSCHGLKGKGDGPIAKTLAGPPPGDLTDDKWTRGDRPEQVLDVIRNGVPGSQMSGWKGSYGDDELRGVAAYVFHLAGREVPGELRHVKDVGAARGE